MSWLRKNRNPEPRNFTELANLLQRNAELELMFHTIQDLTSTLSVQEILERLLARTLLHLDAEIGSVLVCESDDSLRIMLAQGLPEKVIRETRVRMGEGISGFVAQSAMSLHVQDVENDPRFRRRNRERYYTHSFISAPLVLKGRVRGVINVNNKRSHEPFTTDDLRLLEAIAGHAAVSLSNAHRYEEMLMRAQRDGLTGIANQRHFWSTLEVEVGRADRYQREFSIVMVDLDNFKSYNDEHGHVAGDEALANVATLISERCRVSDIPARFGGEEFCVILPETRLEGAVAFADKIRQAIENASFSAEDQRGLTISAGVAAFPTDGDTAKALVQTSNEHLHRAKQAGRNRTCSRD